MLYRLAWILLAVAACDTSTGITAAEIACPTTQTLTYANFGEPLIAEQCLECHTTKERPYLDTQARVQAAISDILSEAVYSSSMPEDGGMTDEERTLLGQWLMCGAP